MFDETKKNCNTCRKEMALGCPVLESNSEYQTIWESPAMDAPLKAFEWKQNFICDDYKSRYIEYPIEVGEIKIEWDVYTLFNRDYIGRFVRIRPCAKEHKGKTYLGLFLGDLPGGPFISYNENTKALTVKPFCNPAIYVFDLKKIIFGMESWWSVVESEDDFKDITTETINDQWYIKAIKSLSEPAS